MSFMKHEFCVIRLGVIYIVTVLDVRSLSTRTSCLLKEGIKVREKFKWYVRDLNEANKG